jgi:hypothetical protein
MNPFIGPLLGIVIVAMFVFAASKRVWITLLLPTVAGLVWTANDMGLFGAHRNNDSLGFFIGWSPIFCLLDLAASATGLAAAAILQAILSYLQRKRPK